MSMSRFHVENIWLFWQLSLGINHGIDTYTKIKECSQASACCGQFCRPASGLDFDCCYSRRKDLRAGWHDLCHPHDGELYMLVSERVQKSLHTNTHLAHEYPISHTFSRRNNSEAVSETKKSPAVHSVGDRAFLIKFTRSLTAPYCKGLQLLPGCKAIGP